MSKKPTMENINELDREITWIKEVLREHETHIKSIKDTLSWRRPSTRFNRYNPELTLNPLTGNPWNKTSKNSMNSLRNRQEPIYANNSRNSINSLNSISFTNSPRTLGRKKKKLETIFSINSNNSPNTASRKIKQGWNKYVLERSRRSNRNLPYRPNSPREFIPGPRSPLWSSNDLPYQPNSPREFIPGPRSPLWSSRN